ncbi:MAG: toll/interleukin-1 receptor domain-containing protein [Leptolyngbyaceae cyanobacterium MO_188.B28]|nr:toll/interleukin-1 receptor domain-containing protein [Leptolyngbyaceae cyanobacterium MO_188.B28]
MSSSGSIFISYRRSDSIAETGRLYDHLENYFGRRRVFKDVDSIPVGVNFREHLEKSVGRCQVLIVVIGPTWTTVAGADGYPRIYNLTDWVRIEIEAALNRGIPIIPLLVNGASMPKEYELPSSLKGLTSWQSVFLRHDPDFRRDVKKLIEGVESLIELTRSYQGSSKGKNRGAHHATQVSSEGTSRPSASSQKNRARTSKVIPRLRLAVFSGLYGCQGFLIAINLNLHHNFRSWSGASGYVPPWTWFLAAAGTWAWAAAGAHAGADAGVSAWVLALVGTLALALAGVGLSSDSFFFLAFGFAGVLAWAGSWPGSWAGVYLKEHVRSSEVLRILLGTATTGLIVGWLLALSIVD